ncbi:hypothetical protein LINGRAHAP2_LOCUS4818 [Linum grandiflorum]
MARLMATTTQRRRLLVTMMFAVVLIILIMRRRRRRRRRALSLRAPPRSIVDRLLAAQQSREHFMKIATRTSDRSSIDVIRMSMHVFRRLCGDLQTKGGLKKFKNVEVDEMVAMFLRTVGNNVKNRLLQKRYNTGRGYECRSPHREGPLSDAAFLWDGFGRRTEDVYRECLRMLFPFL